MRKSLLGLLEAVLRKACLLLLILGLCVSAPSNSQLRFEVLTQPVIEARLKSFTRSNHERMQTMKKLFAEAGCSGEKLTEQPVPHVQQPNIICTQPGASDATIIVGAHFDMVKEGDGVADNWSGAALLPSLYQTLSRRPLQHTHVFISFSAEEEGLLGSEYYAKKLSVEQKNRIQAMLNMDTLGLGPTKVWASHSDKELLGVAVGVADALKLPIEGSNVENAGTTDSEPFFQRKIPALTIHSITQQNLPILHSPHDNISSIRLDDYYKSYRLITGYLTYLDTYLSRPKEDRAATQKKKK